MKTADIEVGAEYAIGSSGDVSKGYAQRGTVLEIGVDRRIYTGSRSFGSRLKTDGVLVALHESGARSEGVFAPVHIQMPWAEYAEQKRVHMEREQQRRAALLDEREHQLGRIAQALGMYETEEHRKFMMRLSTYELEGVASMVEAAYNFGDGDAP